MSSSGKGQSVLNGTHELVQAWQHSQDGARGGAGRVIVEGFVNFDYEITLLTVRHKNGTSFCPPVGHRQVNGDYHESWQPQPMSDVALGRAEDIARQVTDNLGGNGLFGVEFFIEVRVCGF
jgi:phosphoribosylglycinamide formyltransferase 2